MTHDSGLPCPDIAATARLAPIDIVRRRSACWTGIQGDSIEMTRRARFEYGVTPPFHLLILQERGERSDGETIVDGTPMSTQREFSRKLSFIPAGHSFCDWQQPRVLARACYLYIDPRALLSDPELRSSDTAFRPQLFFYDREIWETASKLRAQVETPQSAGYAEALGLVLAHELTRLQGRPSLAASTRGGLAGWQKKKVADYIEDHLGDDISLRQIATVIDLSPFHFARAFRQSFGAPPHRYHMMRRIERAKTMLNHSASSVTQIGAALGFSDTSAFTTAFRRRVGATPTEFRRAII